MSKYPKSEYGNTRNMSTRQQNEANYPKYEYGNTQNTSMACKLIRAQAEQIRETPTEHAERKCKRDKYTGSRH